MQQSQSNSQICNENRLQRISEQLKRKRFVLATIGDNNNGEGVLFKMNVIIIILKNKKKRSNLFIQNNRIVRQMVLI